MKKKVLVSVLGILGIVATTIGIIYAFFSYSKTGTTLNTIRTGSIEFKYTEGSRVIELTEAMPMSDLQEKNQTNYFEFTITSKSTNTIEVPYDITVRKATGDNIIKIYLTKVNNVDNSEIETQVVLSKISDI